MSLPALATLSDLNARTPGGVDEADETRAQAALDDASALVRAESGKDWVDDDDNLIDPLPAILVTVTCAAARRAMINPDGATQESLDGYSQSFRNDSADVYLTRNERRLARKAAGRGGVSVIPTTRGPVETGTAHGGRPIPERGSLVDVNGGEPVPWLPDGP